MSGNNSVEIMWALYKPSGKYVGGSVINISGKNKLWHTDAILAEIDSQQQEVDTGIIQSRSYHLAIQETPAQMADPDYDGFFTHMFVAAG